MIRVLFLNRRFEPGGAERQLIELIKGMNKTLFSVVVATFYEGGALHAEVKSIDDVLSVSLHKKRRWDVLPFVYRLWSEARKHNPQIVHGYIGEANVFSLLAGRLAGAKVVWGVRASNMDLSRYNWLFTLTFRLECFFSRFADLIIVNSTAGRAYHLAHGFPADKMVVIHNGIDTERFKPDREAGAKVRTEWGVSKDTILIGLIGRLDPMKDHPTFLRAAALMCEDRRDVRFVCVGNGQEDYVRQMQQLTRKLGVFEKVIWTGVRADMSAVYGALDIASSSSSYGEGFSNVIGEAMACGVPCVVTDVGDSALIVGDAGIVVPPHDPEALAAGWKLCLQKDRIAMGMKARLRIIEDFSVQRLVEQTENAILQVVRKESLRSSP
ncbi:MAG: glycosyltransferase [Pyrinomonadaceae bacterium]|nr:glycosyltransferase [Pyrinomonadaceae bacterium]